MRIGLNLPNWIRKLFNLDSDTCSSWFYQYDGDDLVDEVVRSLTSGGIISDNEIIARRLANVGTIECFVKGETLVKKGEGGNDVFFLLHGRVTVERGKDGPIDRDAPVTIGEMAAMNPGKPRSATVWARTGDVATLKVSARDFTEILRENPDIANRLNMDLNARFYSLLDYVHDLEGHLRTRNSRYFWPLSMALSVAAGGSVWSYANAQGVEPSLTIIAGLGGSLAILYAAVVLNPVYRFSRLLGVLVVSWLGVNALPSAVASVRSKGVALQFTSPEISSTSQWVFLGLALILGALIQTKE